MNVKVKMQLLINSNQGYVVFKSIKATVFMMYEKNETSPKHVHLHHAKNT
eukprot:m.9456 g.9456  ORF g.9456 m.9456 type:complete len:50 (+) comp6357_c1_seq1:232-381(+)